MYVHLGKLKDDDRLLWENVRIHLRLSPDAATDIREINEDELTDNFKQRLLDFNQHQRKARENGITPLPAKSKADYEQDLRDEQADVQRRVDEQRGKDRLNEYVAAGLEDTQKNADAIREWLDENVKGYLSQTGVDLAVQWLGPRSKNVLTWKPKTVAPPPPPAPEPTEVLLKLPDGTTQLSLDVDNRTLSKASKDQARDYLKRVNAGKLLRPAGGFGSSF